MQTQQTAQTNSGTAAAAAAAVNKPVTNAHNRQSVMGPKTPMFQLLRSLNLSLCLMDLTQLCWNLLSHWHTTMTQ
jgi:hypothetical protein